MADIHLQLAPTLFFKLLLTAYPPLNMNHCQAHLWRKSIHHIFPLSLPLSLPSALPSLVLDVSAVVFTVPDKGNSTWETRLKQMSQNENLSASGSWSQRSSEHMLEIHSRTVLRVQDKVITTIKAVNLVRLQALTCTIKETFDPPAFMHLLCLYACRRASIYHCVSSMVNGICSRRESRKYRTQS